MGTLCARLRDSREVLRSSLSALPVLAPLADEVDAALSPALPALGAAAAPLTHLHPIQVSSARWDLAAQCCYCTAPCALLRTAHSNSCTGRQTALSAAQHRQVSLLVHACSMTTRLQRSCRMSAQCVQQDGCRAHQALKAVGACSERAASRSGCCHAPGGEASAGGDWYCSSGLLGDAPLLTSSSPSSPFQPRAPPPARGEEMCASFDCAKEPKTLQHSQVCAAGVNERHTATCLAWRHPFLRYQGGDVSSRQRSNLSGQRLMGVDHVKADSAEGVSLFVNLQYGNSDHYLMTFKKG